MLNIHAQRKAAATPPMTFGRFTTAEAVHWRRRMQKTARPCGCKAGAALALAAVVLWPVRFVAEPPRTVIGAGLMVAVYGLVVVAAGLGGKLAGITVGRLQHQYFRRRLARHVANSARRGGH